MDDSAHNRGDLELIEQLITQLLEGVISQPDRAKLNDLLLGSAEGRRLYLQYAQIDSGLNWIYTARQQAATVIDGTVPGDVRPMADIAQQQLQFADDARFIRAMQAFASNESHRHDWLQLFPRILAVTTLCVAPATRSDRAVQAIVDKLLAEYVSEMSPAAFWAATADATHEVVFDAVAGDENCTAVAAALLDCAFASPEETPALDAIAIHEILEECIPHRLPADTLRVLCLRYLHGLPPRRIALHVNRSVQHVQLHLAKVRVHLVHKCLAGAGDDSAHLDGGELLRWSRSLDTASQESVHQSASSSHILANPCDATHLLLLAIVHDYLERGLSPTRLLDEIPTQRNKSYLQAVEQSLRDIESLGTTRTRADLSMQRGKRSPSTLQLAAVLGIAAALLIAVGIGAWLGRAPESSGVLIVKEQAPPVTEPEAPPQIEVSIPPAPIQRPVVAVISEVIGVSADDQQRLGVGSMIRIEDVIAFERGIVQFATISGSTVVLEGPVDASVTDKNRFALRRGKVTGLNKTVGESLIIDAPNSSIVDVGTEFGVSVSESQKTDVAVFQGEVRLESPSTSSDHARGETLELKAGWEARIETSIMAPAQPTRLAHDRGFIRSDEVQLRKEALNGNSDSAAKVAFFEMLRTDGLLAYQGFHQASSGADFALGFRAPGMRQVGQTLFKSNINKSNGRLGTSHSLATEKDVSCYLDLDASSQSRIARTGLTDESGLIGNRPGELWLCWRTKAYGTPATKFSWAGVSLMYGDNRSVEEPIFVGQPAPMPLYGIHIYAAQGGQMEVVSALDKDVAAAGEQPFQPDFDEHLWLLRLRLNSPTTEAAVWCDVEPGQVANVPPNVVQTIQQFRFDRLRFEAHPEGEEGGWLYDDIIVATSSDAIAETLRLIEKAPRN